MLRSQARVLFIVRLLVGQTYRTLSDVSITVPGKSTIHSTFACQANIPYARSPLYGPAVFRKLLTFLNSLGAPPSWKKNPPLSWVRGLIRREPSRVGEGSPVGIARIPPAPPATTSLGRTPRTAMPLVFTSPPPPGAGASAAPAAAGCPAWLRRTPGPVRLRTSDVSVTVPGKSTIHSTIACRANIPYALGREYYGPSQEYYS